MINKLEDLIKVEYSDKTVLAVVACHDKEILLAINESYNLGLIEPILIGDIIKTQEIADVQGFNIDKFKLIDEKDLIKAAEIGVKLVNNGEADFIIKGLVDTSILLKAVLNKEWGLRTNHLLSHVVVYEVPTYGKLLYLTDGGMNLSPSLDEKVKIIENASIVARALGNRMIKVAVLAAKEKIDYKMPATIDANELKLKCNNHEFTSGIIVDGPMSLDIAISKEAAEIKGFNSPVAGDADILLVPNIEMGNGIGKSITHFAKGKSAGIVMGAKVPIVLVSRADDHITKLYSIALGRAIIANKVEI